MKCIKYSALGFTCIGMGKDSEDASAPDWLEHSHQPASQPASHPVFPISRCPRGLGTLEEAEFKQTVTNQQIAEATGQGPLDSTFSRSTTQQCLKFEIQLWRSFHHSSTGHLNVRLCTHYTPSKYVVFHPG